MGELWPGLASTLSRLDVLAGEPSGMDDDAAPSALRRLQYALHVAGEHLHGLEPPPGAASAHAELADALACARDATAEVAEAASAWGSDGVEPLLPNGAARSSASDSRGSGSQPLRRSAFVRPSRRR